MYSSEGHDETGIRFIPSHQSESLISRSYHRDYHSRPERNIPLRNENLPKQNNGDVPIRINNLVSTHRPRHPQMASLSTRLMSFRDWPQAMPQKPQQLAEAGFFYLGKYH